MELKDFEEKINNITEQFMSLLDSNDVIESSTENKFDSITESFDKQIDGHTYFNSSGNIGGITNNTSAFKLGADGINIGGMAYTSGSDYYGKTPAHAIKFDSVEQSSLNEKLEDLYITKKESTSINYNKAPSIAFSDSKLGKINSLGNYDTYIDSTNDETHSTLYNKEGYDMSGYNGEGKENTFYSFATIPAEKSLVEKRDWKDVLFMDIPWDTKIDIWGGIKKFCTAQVKITF